jgi:hypothetical protein
MSMKKAPLCLRSLPSRYYRLTLAATPVAPVVALVVPVEVSALAPAATSPSSFGAQIHLFHLLFRSYQPCYTKGR